jgi:anti-anti-sigma regulatory factor
VITLTMVLVGVLEGVALGILLAMVLFIAEYSRGTPIRWAVTGRTYRSNVDRPPAHTAALREHGDDILVLELQRFICFGTANRLLGAVRSRLDDADHPPRYVILDFRRVTGLDASAGSSFTKIGQLAAAREVTVILSGLSGRMRDQLGPGGFAGDDPAWRIDADLDHAAEWCEEQVLADLGDTGAVADDHASDDMVDLTAYMHPRHLPTGATLIAEGRRSSPTSRASCCSCPPGSCGGSTGSIRRRLRTFTARSPAWPARACSTRWCSCRRCAERDVQRSPVVADGPASTGR